MGVTLTQLKLFSKIQTRLDAVTTENLTSLQPGKPVPDSAQVIGEMSPALKALLFIRNDLSIKANQALAEFVVKADDMDEDAQEAASRAHQALKDEVQFYDKVFWAALRDEFLRTQDMSFGYGPNFEIYVYEASDSPLAGALADLLMSGLVIGRRPRR